MRRIMILLPILPNMVDDDDDDDDDNDDDLCY